MAEATQTLDANAHALHAAMVDQQVCPFCGNVRENAQGPCPRCTLENSPGTRHATKSRIGPWYVLQARNPAAPGMKFDTLLAFLRKGRIKARSVVRGPTTHQLWRFAAQVKGLSREFGLCYSCGRAINPKAALCPHCNRLQEPPANPDAFLEGQDGEIVSPMPIMGEIAPEPTPTEDIVVPAIGMSSAAPAAQDPAAAPAQATKLKNTDGILTPEELAAAFKIDFQPKKKRWQRKAAQTNEQHRPSRPRRRRRWGRFILVFLLAAVIAAAVYLYLTNPQIKSKADSWYAQAATWTQTKWNSLRKTSPSNSPRPVAPDALPQATTQPAEAQPAATQPAPVQTRPSQWDQIFAAPTGGIDDVLALYRSAIDEEAKGNDESALKKFAQIQRYPKELWPRDLSLRIKQIRARVNSK